jgi:hypothetical protein
MNPRKMDFGPNSNLCDLDIAQLTDRTSGVTISNQTPLEKSLDTIRNLATANTTLGPWDPEEFAICRGLMSKLKGEGLNGNGCSVGYIINQSGQPHFHISYGENILSYGHNNNLITLGSGIPFKPNGLIQAGGSEEQNALQITEAFGAVQKLIEDEIKQKRSLLEKALQYTHPDDLKADPKSLLEIVEALSGLTTLLASQSMKDLYLSGEDDDDMKLQCNRTGYDCRPPQALGAINNAFSTLLQSGLRIGQPLAIPLRNALGQLEDDIKSREPIIWIVHEFRQVLDILLPKTAVSADMKHNLSRQRFKGIEKLLQEVKDIIEYMYYSDMEEFTTSPYLNALLQAADPEWLQQK